ncbi:MAG: hypothetical protein JWN37_303 [Candidatus Nomurabacteria bacterium]|nr:hypothetical protein [Candidatus Nomurabacteria bacterium]
MKKNLVAIIITLISIPVLVYAQATTPTQGITSLGTFVDAITSSVVRALATLFLAGAVAAFFFGIVNYLIGARDGDQTKIKNGNQFMLWGLIAIFVMFSVWGIVKYAQGILGLPSSSSIDIPQVRFNTGGSGTTATGTPGLSPGGGTPNSGTTGLRAGGGTPNTGTPGLPAQSHGTPCISEGQSCTSPEGYSGTCRGDTTPGAATDGFVCDTPYH